MKQRFYYFILIGCATIAGCTPGQKKVDITAQIKTPVIMDPFRYHKLIEVSPGQYYDVLSWGRGATDTGSFLILHSDSSGKKYTTTTGDLNGKIVDVYNADMDADGNPEILIQAKGKDTINYTTIYAYEFNDNKAQKLDFPKLSGTQKRGYRGNDNFYIEEGKLIREFPIYTGSGVAAKPTGQQRKLEYGLSNNSFTVKQLSKDSLSSADKAAVQQPQSKHEGKQTKGKKAAKKHHKAVVHKKKRRRRHNSEE